MPKAKAKLYSREEALLSLLYQQEEGMHTGAQTRIYRRKLFDGIRYPVGFFVEDLATTYRVFFKCAKIAYTPERLYCYRLRHDSQLHTSYSPKMLSCIPVSRQLYSEISAKYPELRLAAASRAFSANRSTYFLLPKDHKEERMQVWEEMKKYRREVLFDPHARKRERLAALVSYLGPGFFHMFSKIYRRYLMRERG